MKIGKNLRIVFSVILVFTMLTGTNATVFAAERIIISGESSVFYGEGYIAEYDELQIGTSHFEIERITYENNRAILKITENGNTEVITFTNNYERLLQNLHRNVIPQVMNMKGLDYRYLTTFTYSDHVTPENSTYNTILSAVSLALAIYGVPGAVVVSIASLLYGLNSSAVEAWITTKRVCYEVYDSTGTFLGYYYVEYTVTTEAKVNGIKKQIDKETGNYTTLTIY